MTRSPKARAVPPLEKALGYISLKRQNTPDGRKAPSGVKLYFIVWFCFRRAEILGINRVSNNS